MELFLACVAFSMSGGMSTVPAGSATIDLGMVYTQRKIGAQQNCSAHKTLEDAVLAYYRRGELDATLQLYRVRVDDLAIEKITTPQVRIVVEKN